MEAWEVEKYARDYSLQTTGWAPQPYIYNYEKWKTEQGLKAAKLGVDAALRTKNYGEGLVETGAKSFGEGLTSPLKKYLEPSNLFAGGIGLAAALVIGYVMFKEVSKRV